jgi:hypothetical protein
VKKIYAHSQVDHSRGRYVNGDVTTNTIERFWSILKRGIIGIYHHASCKYLQLYANEYEFRYNTRKQSDMDRFYLFSTKDTHKKSNFERCDESLLKDRCLSENEIVGRNPGKSSLSHLTPRNVTGFVTSRLVRRVSTERCDSPIST